MVLLHEHEPIKNAASRGIFYGMESSYFFGAVDKGERVAYPLQGCERLAPPQLKRNLHFLRNGRKLCSSQCCCIVGVCTLGWVPENFFDVTDVVLSFCELCRVLGTNMAELSRSSYLVRRVCSNSGRRSRLWEVFL